MKMKIGIIGIVIIIIIGIGIYSYRKNKENPKVKEITKLQLFKYHYINGNSMYANTDYQLECNEKCIATIKSNGIPEEQSLIVEVKEETVTELINLLNEYKVGYWNGFQKSDKRVKDGHSFSIGIKVQDDIYISASGYMKYPKNFREVSKKIENIFQSIYDQNKKE